MAKRGRPRGSKNKTPSWRVRSGKRVVSGHSKLTLAKKAAMRRAKKNRTGRASVLHESGVVVAVCGKTSCHNTKKGKKLL